MVGTVNSLAAIIPKPPRIRRKILRKYSWLPDVLRIEGSIVRRILGPVLTVTLFATAVAYAWHKGHNVHLTNSVIPVVAVVVGLILVFRNGTSYDRYWEGRKDFATMISHIRNISRLLWINVALPPPDGNKSATKTPTSDLTAFALRRKKTRVIKLCLGFAYAAKHYLRGEDGIDHPDYEDVLPASFIRHGQLEHSHSASRRGSVPPSLHNGFDNSSSTAPDIETERADHGDATKRVRVKRSNPTLRERTPLLSQSGAHAINFGDEDMSTPLPMVIAHEITRAIFVFKRDGLLETVGPAGTNTLNTLVQGLIDNLSNMERIANTPIPKAYTIHLKQIVSLYLFALPFTLVKELGWGMIPIVTVVAFTFMGIEGIADEIEMPFGTDKGDLPLERYCADLKEEIDYLLARLPEGGEGMYGYDDGEGDD